jgi:hypothetical protein
MLTRLVPKEFFDLGVANMASDWMTYVSLKISSFFGVSEIKEFSWASIES